MRFYMVGKQVQYFLFYTTGVLAHLQETVPARHKAGNIITLFKYPEFAAFTIVVQVFPYFKIMNFLIIADYNRVIFHAYPFFVTTIDSRVCLTRYRLWG